jgi:hypothetical protein
MKMADGKRSQEVEGAYKKDNTIYFYNGTIIIGEDKNLTGSVDIRTDEESILGKLEGKLEELNNQNYLIFKIALPFSNQYHILKKQDSQDSLIGQYPGKRYGINNTQTIMKEDLLSRIHPMDIPRELMPYARGGSVFYLGISEHQYSWNKTKEKIKKFFGVK